MSNIYAMPKGAIIKEIVNCGEMKCQNNVTLKLLG